MAEHVTSVGVADAGDASSSKRRAVAVDAGQGKVRTGLVVKRNQRGNALLRYIRSVPYEFEDVVPDFVMGDHCCALFLSLRYHLLHPGYIYDRVRNLGTLFRQRILLCLVDVDDHRKSVVELTKMCMLNQLTLMCAASNKEAARYLETYRAYQNKSTSDIQEHIEEDYPSRLTAVLCAVRAVNKTDAKMISANIGSVQDIFTASAEQLRQVPGLGERKVARLHDAFNQPFKVPKKPAPESS